MHAHKLTRVSLALLTAFSFSAASLAVEPEKVTIYDTDGTELVHFLVLPEGEEDTEGFKSTGVYPKEFDSAFRRVFSYNKNLVGGHKGAAPTITLLPYKEEGDIGNAFASSEIKGYLGLTEFSTAYVGSGITESEKDSPIAKIGINIIGTNKYTGSPIWTMEAQPSLPQSTKEDIFSVVFHELVHAYGLSADVGQVLDDETGQVEITRFDNKENFSLYSSGLRDYFGTPAAPEMEIQWFKPGEITAETRNPNIFYIEVPYKDGIPSDGRGLYYVGDHVTEVLGKGTRIALPDDPTISVPGLPINSIEIGAPDSGESGGDADDDEQGQGNTLREEDNWEFEFSHIELQNSLLSHQSYRNWGIPMEAELALLQDLGLEIDRRNFFGYSVYKSGDASAVNTVVNTNPFYARKEDGTSFIIGAPNKNLYGIGLHIYGSYNHVIQKAELLADGTFGIGIRVDGANNTIDIPEETRITANGTQGYGIVFSYGKEHVLNVAGSVEATGSKGVALRFDFGQNMLGDEVGGTRGSYVCSDCTEVPDAIDGALMQQVNIQGQLKAAADGYAIYISDNAHVKEINILPGAIIEGKIQSDWDRYLKDKPSSGDISDVPEEESLSQDEYPGNETAEEYRTALNLGDRNKGGQLDYAYDILGSKSIELNIVGREVNYTGKAEVLNVTIEKDGVLSGGAHYVLTQKESEPATLRLEETELPDSKDLGVFLNRGTLKADSLHGVPQIQGDYIQENTAVLQLSVNSDGSLIQMPVSGDSVIKGGTISLLPGPGFYEGVTPLSTTNLTTSNTEIQESKVDYEISPDFSSPTLNFVAEPSDQGVSLVLKTSPYQQYARGLAEAQIGSILTDNRDHVESQEVKDLYTALDFSSADGAQLAEGLHSLTGPIYAQSILGSFGAQRMIHNTIALGKANTPDHGTAVWAQPFGGRVYGKSSDGSYSNRVMGFAFGAETKVDSLRYGADFAAAHYSLSNTPGAGTFRGKGVWLGGHVGSDGTVTTDTSLMVGFLDGKTKRNLSVGSFNQNCRSTGLQYSWALTSKVGLPLQLTENSTFKPIVGAAWEHIYTPARNEKGSSAAKLKWKHGNFNSFVIKAGFELDHNFLASEKSGGSVFVQSFYERELLNRAGRLSGSLSGLQGSFSKSVDWESKNRWTTAVGASYRSGLFSLKASVAAEVKPSHGTSVFGSLKLTRTF